MISTDFRLWLCLSSVTYVLEELGEMLVSGHTVSLHPEVVNVTFTALLQEFAKQVSRVSDQQFDNQISWDDAIAQIELLIEEFRLTAQQLGFLTTDDSEYDLKFEVNLRTQLELLADEF